MVKVGSKIFAFFGARRPADRDRAQVRRPGDGRPADRALPAAGAPSGLHRRARLEQHHPRRHHPRRRDRRADRHLVRADRGQAAEEGAARLSEVVGPDFVGRATIGSSGDPRPSLTSCCCRPSTSPAVRPCSWCRAGPASEKRFGDPRAAAQRWQDAGAEWIHLVDLDAAFGRGHNAEIIAEVTAHAAAQVELSGGIRDDDSLERALATGCARVNIGTAALEQPEWCAEVIAAYGDKIAIGLDVRGQPARGPRLDPRRRRPARDPATGWTRPAAPGSWSPTSTPTACSPGPTSTCCGRSASETDEPVVASGGISRAHRHRRARARWFRSASKVRSSARPCTSATSPSTRPCRRRVRPRQRAATHDHGTGRHVPPRRRTPSPPAIRQQLDGRLRDLLAGKKIVMTGVTGLHRRAAAVEDPHRAARHPPCGPGPAQGLGRRPGPGAGRAASKPIFAEVREAAGGPDALLDGRIDVIEGDLPERARRCRPTSTSWCTAPGDVSFDPPIDQAFTTNVVGTQHLMERMLEAVTDRRRQPPVKVPHYVHISTAYTAGRRRGAIPEAAHEHTVDYQAETAAGLRMRDLIEAESRTPERLATLRKQAERRASPGRVPDHGRRHRAPPAGVGAGRAGQGRHRASALPRLDRRLHLHQGPRRAGRRRPGGRDPGLDRPAGHRRVVVEASLSRAGSRASRWPSR